MASTSRTGRSEDPRPIINFTAFDQILELDDDDAHAYSKDMVSMYFAQAPAAFAGMDAALAETNLRTLADLAHFLMGSSATLGIARVAAACERMESVGEASLTADAESEAGGAADDRARDRDAGGDKESALKQIAALLEEGKREYADAERWLRRWYADHGQGFAEDDATTKSSKPEEEAVPPRAAASTEKSRTVDTIKVVINAPTPPALQPTQKTPPKDARPTNRTTGP